MGTLMTAFQGGVEGLRNMGLALVIVQAGFLFFVLPGVRRAVATEAKFFVIAAAVAVAYNDVYLGDDVDYGPGDLAITLAISVPITAVMA